MARSTLITHRGGGATGTSAKSSARNLLSGERVRPSTKLRNETGLSCPLVIAVLEGNAVKPGKGMKGVTIGQEKAPRWLFRDGLIVYLGRPRIHTLSIMIRELSRKCGFPINRQNHPPVYTSDTENEFLKTTFTMASKIEIPRNKSYK